MRLKTLVTAAAIVVVVAVGGVIGFLSQVDPNDYRQDIANALQDATGRTVTLGGNLSLQKSLSPTLVVENVTIANADWSKSGDMASIKSLGVEVELLPLISGVIVVNSLILDGGVIHLETDSDGQANWEFSSDGSSAGSSQQTQQLSFRSVSIKDTQVTYSSPGLGQDLSLNVSDLELTASGPDEPLDVKSAFDLNGTAFSLTGTLKTLASLVEGKDTAIDLTLTSDNLTVSATGTMGDPGTEDFLAFDVTGDLKSAQALAALGIDLGDLVDQAALSAKVTGGTGKLSFDDLVLTASGSTIKGKAVLDMTGEHTALSGSLSVDQIDLDALTQSAETEVESTGRVFPDTPLPFDALHALDLKLDLTVDTVKAQGLVFTKVASDIVLTDGKLTLDPLSFVLSKATVAGTAHANAGGPALALSLKADDMDVGALLVALDATTKLTGTADVVLDVSGTGTSLAGIADTLDGKASVLMENGKLDVHELDLLVGGLTTIIGSLFSKGVDTAQLNCLALAWDVKAGVAEQKVLLLDTQYSTVTGSGSIDLGKETLALKIVPHAKDATLNLSVPVHIGGTLLKPTYTPDEGALALRIGGLIGATLFPPAVLLALGDLGSSDGGCSKANQPTTSSGVAGTVEGVTNDVGNAVDDVVKGVGDTIDSLFE
jgi:uncharacterized protein involved in outer membrane biogenesis